MVILKGIPSILTPELLYVLARMGHGDELVLADANFPTASICKCGPAEIRADETLVTVEFLKYQKYLLYQIPRKIIFDGCNGGTCVGIPELLKAIMKLFPLDTYDDPAAVMDLVQSDKLKGLKVPIWDQYSSLLKQAGSDSSFKFVERFAFYERAKNAFAVVATGETALYGNLIIKKGVISPDEQC